MGSEFCFWGNAVRPFWSQLELQGGQRDEFCSRKLRDSLSFYHKLSSLCCSCASPNPPGTPPQLAKIADATCTSPPHLDPDQALGDMHADSGASPPARRPGVSQKTPGYPPIHGHADQAPRGNGGACWRQCAM